MNDQTTNQSNEALDADNKPKANMDLLFHAAGNYTYELTSICHGANAQWWVDMHTGASLTSKAGEPPKVNIPEKLMLIVSEVAEAMEGHRKNLNDDKLPDRKMLEVELADTVIRVFDLAGGLGLDLGGALREKLRYNASRVDHTHAHRLAQGGKSF